MKLIPGKLYKFEQREGSTICFFKDWGSKTGNKTGRTYLPVPQSKSPISGSILLALEEIDCKMNPGGDFVFLWGTERIIFCSDYLRKEPWALTLVDKK